MTHLARLHHRHLAALDALELNIRDTLHQMRESGAGTAANGRRDSDVLHTGKYCPRGVPEVMVLDLQHASILTTMEVVLQPGLRFCRFCSCRVQLKFRRAYVR